jgi:hypothetical protein
LQVYAQLFSAYGRYGPFYLAEPDGPAGIRLADLREVPAPAENPSFHTSALRVNVVLRWEYQLGSTLFLVYARTQDQQPPPAGLLPPASIWPGPLLRGPATDMLLIKWTHAWGV